MTYEWLQFLSQSLGWIYFLAWSISFYPQAILNYKRKSVQGLSIDFLSYNVYGFTCYSIYVLSFYFSSSIQEEYKSRHDGKANLVKINDVFFACHALLLSSIQLYQTFIYKRDSNQQKSQFASYVICGFNFIVFTTLIATFYGFIKALDFLYIISYIKVATSLIKYCPQAFINYKRKSTIGWSIHNILLDFTGGILSIVQLVLDAFIQQDWGGILGNPVKLFLGNTSIIFDILFITQHYVLYRHSNSEQDKGYHLARNENGYQALE
ncbi:lysosomal cystine transporter [Conidiobolus coronatus NRRL 28638]|uniref:Lysosomal cystine transporter n=1 Tax=Conidiobolus coronatus (strain ATCC 28846 / CBS 209.66 / NRRL 28638) TaxID=796925 RepID=A0A137P398_CONC2|nr:lysosomal cystine transporter [Conidiobolus coronatus NRRL 28638]|eukprot:KXN69505.1 lysosomal cystine transporter [Conidiobolus coronatus NRRL 28638]